MKKQEFPGRPLASNLRRFTGPGHPRSRRAVHLGGRASPSQNERRETACVLTSARVASGLTSRGHALRSQVRGAGIHWSHQTDASP